MVRFRVAGLTLAARGPGRALSLPGPLRPFACARGQDIRLELSREPVPQPPRGDLLFESGAVWRVHRWRGGFLYSFRTPRLDPPVYKAVAIDRALARGTLYYPPPRRGRPPLHALDFPLDELLFQHRLAREGGMEVHACGVVVDGRAVLFCGRSGAGKTTMARIWRRSRPRDLILSDDRVILRERWGRLLAYGTPWHGEGGFASPQGRPLGAVFFLRHGRGSRLIPLPASLGASRLFARSFPPPWDAMAVGNVLSTCARAVRLAVFSELSFRPDRSAIAPVLAALDASAPWMMSTQSRNFRLAAK